MTPYDLEEAVRKVRKEVELASGNPYESDFIDHIHQQTRCNAAIISLLCTLVQHEADNEAERILAAAAKT